MSAPDVAPGRLVARATGTAALAAVLCRYVGDALTVTLAPAHRTSPTADETDEADDEQAAADETHPLTRDATTRSFGSAAVRPIAGRPPRPLSPVSSAGHRGDGLLPVAPLNPAGGAEAPIRSSVVQTRTPLTGAPLTPLLSPGATPLPLAMTTLGLSPVESWRPRPSAGGERPPGTRLASPVQRNLLLEPVRRHRTALVVTPPPALTLASMRGAAPDAAGSPIADAALGEARVPVALSPAHTARTLTPLHPSGRRQVPAPAPAPAAGGALRETGLLVGVGDDVLVLLRIPGVDAVRIGPAAAASAPPPVVPTGSAAVQAVSIRLKTVTAIAVFNPRTQTNCGAATPALSVVPACEADASPGGLLRRRMPPLALDNEPLDASLEGALGGRQASWETPAVGSIHLQVSGAFSPGARNDSIALPAGSQLGDTALLSPVHSGGLRPDSSHQTLECVPMAPLSPLPPSLSGAAELVAQAAVRRGFMLHAASDAAAICAIPRLIAAGPRYAAGDNAPDAAPDAAADATGEAVAPARAPPTAAEVAGWVGHPSDADAPALATLLEASPALAEAVRLRAADIAAAEPAELAEWLTPHAEAVCLAAGLAAAPQLALADPAPRRSAASLCDTVAGLVPLLWGGLTAVWAAAAVLGLAVSLFRSVPVPPLFAAWALRYWSLCPAAAALLSVAMLLLAGRQLDDRGRLLRGRAGLVSLAVSEGFVVLVLVGTYFAADTLSGALLSREYAAQARRNPAPLCAFETTHKCWGLAVRCADPATPREACTSCPYWTDAAAARAAAEGAASGAANILKPECTPFIDALRQRSYMTLTSMGATFALALALKAAVVVVGTLNPPRR